MITNKEAIESIIIILFFFYRVSLIRVIAYVCKSDRLYSIYHL